MSHAKAREAAASPVVAVGRGESGGGETGAGIVSVDRISQAATGRMQDAPDGSPRPRVTPPRKLYQDEIYGTKELTPLALACVDTPEFQRLSRVLQLGFTALVFRGANHSRLEHSLGTYFVCRTLLRRVVQNHARLRFAHPGTHLSPRLYQQAPETPEWGQSPDSPMGRWRGLTEVVSAAALLHDLGQVPLGHTLEDEFGLIGKHDMLGGPRVFDMLYGPRRPIASDSCKVSFDAPPRVESYFSAITAEKLARPEPWQRVPLPWVFEEGTYEPFLQKAGSAQQGADPLANPEIRDLIYLTLSFKETVEESGNYRAFAEEIAEAYSKSRNDEARLARLRFLEHLYRFHSRPLHLPHPESPSLPLFHPFMADFVANTICADLIDYLVRDGKRVKLDIRDNSRLQRYMVLRPSSRPDSQRSADLRLTIHAVHGKTGLPRRDTVSDLLDLMRERYRFAEVVYYHPKKACFSAMFAEAARLLWGDRIRDEDPVYPAPWSLQSEGVCSRNLTHYGDDSLVRALADDASLRITRNEGTIEARSALSLLSGILWRQEYRLLFTLDYGTLLGGAGGKEAVTTFVRVHLRPRIVHLQRELESICARSALWSEEKDGSSPVLIYCPDVRMQAKEIAAHAETQVGTVLPLNQKTDDHTLETEIGLINEKYRQLWRLYLFIHPKLSTDEWGNRDLSSAIIQSLTEFCGVRDDRQRTRGARRGYDDLVARCDHYLDDWWRSVRDAGISRGMPAGTERELSATIHETDFWKFMKGQLGVVADSEVLPFCPVGQSEYRTGFTAAIAIAAADSAEQRERENWSERLSTVRDREWWQASNTRADEDLRRRAVTAIFRVADDGLTGDRPGENRGAPEDWSSFVNSVSRALRQVR